MHAALCNHRRRRHRDTERLYLKSRMWDVTQYCSTRCTTFPDGVINVCVCVGVNAWWKTNNIARVRFLEAYCTFIFILSLSLNLFVSHYHIVFLYFLIFVHWSPPQKTGSFMVKMTIKLELWTLNFELRREVETLFSVCPTLWSRERDISITSQQIA